MRIFLIILTIFAFVMCSSLDKTPAHVRQIHQIMSKFISHTKQKYHINCCGTGRSFIDNVSKLHLSYNATGPKTLQEMRYLIVTIAKDFLNLINNEPDIKKYLSNYPFTVNNLEIGIAFYNDSNRKNFIMNVGSSKVLLSHVLLLNGKIIYNIFNDDQINLQKFFEESYEDAYMIVHEKS